MRTRDNGNDRRAYLEAHAPGSHTPKQWRAQLQSQGFLCFWCGRKMVEKGGKWRATKDHLTPLIRGGSNFIDNIVGACKPCNCKKQSRTAEEYRALLKAEGKRISAICTLSDSTKKVFSVRELAPDVRQLTAPLLTAKGFPVRPAEYWPERRAFLKWQVQTLMKNEAASLALLGVEVKRA